MNLLFNHFYSDFFWDVLAYRNTRAFVFDFNRVTKNPPYGFILANESNLKNPLSISNKISFTHGPMVRVFESLVFPEKILQFSAHCTQNSIIKRLLFLLLFFVLLLQDIYQQDRNGPGL